MSNLLEFLFIKFKPSLLPTPTTPPASFTTTAKPLLSAPGVEALYLGPSLEQPDLFIAIIRWASPSAYSSFIASPASTEWHAALRALLSEPPLANHAVYEGDVDAVLSAPCTEVCTAWGTEDSFLAERMAPFARAVGSAGLEGFHAVGWGGFEQEDVEGVEVVTGKAVTLILGWDSKEAHLQHKGVGSGEFFMTEMAL